MEWYQNFIMSDASTVASEILYVLGSTTLGVSVVAGCVAWREKRNGKH